MESAVTPHEYCLKWIPTLYGKQSDAHGFRKACVAELAWLTDYAEKSVDNWGKDFERAPKAINRICEMADLINQAGQCYTTFRDGAPNDP